MMAGARTSSLLALVLLAATGLAHAAPDMGQAVRQPTKKPIA
jgi:hypothetical protein